ncbi:MAG: tail fiber domain-containing protein [Bacteroidia bacterium]|nr:tail fiber domain-containing protein [Bacteroidia bacterium]
MKQFIFSIISIFISIVVFAQSPQSFKYQAVVRDAGGSVIQSQNVNFQISIISGSVNGTVEYVESHSAITNTFGIVNLNIGLGTPVTNTFSAINWSNNLHFIKVEADPTGGTNYIDMGTTQLLSVPYALYAETAGNVQTYTSGNGINITGNVVTNSSPDQTITLTQNGATTVTGTYPNFTISSTDLNTGTPGGLNKTIQFNNSGVFDGNSNFTWDNSNERLGVGLNNPTGRMVVQGSTTAPATEPLFEVKNKAGQSVFVVYEDSVNVFVNDDAIQSNRGGFAVSGRNNAKAFTNKYLNVTPDNSKIWTKDTLKGFGVENINGTNKTGYMQMTPNNYLIGHLAGNSLTTGKYNSFIGYQSGFNDTSGYKNYFIGYRTGYNNSNGYSNVFMGDSAGFSNTTGYHNVFIGNQSGLSNIGGAKNIGIGNGSLFSNISGWSDIAIGDEALSHNTFGYFNIAIGRYSLWQNTIGSINTSIGNGALMNNTDAHYNTAIGGGCLQYLDNGNGNTALGALALEYITFGINNTALGYQAFQTSDPIGNSTALGADAQINLSNKVRIGDVTVQIIEGQVAYSFPSDGRFKNNVTEDVKGLDFITKLRPIVYNFDTRKFDSFLMQDMTDSLRESIMSKKDYSESTNIRQTGFIAQEIEQAAKESGYNFNGVHKPANEKDNYSVSYSLFTVPLVKAVQELNSKNQELNNEINLLKTKISEIDNLKAEIEKLKSYIKDTEK